MEVKVITGSSNKHNTAVPEAVFMYVLVVKMGVMAH